MIRVEASLTSLSASRDEMNARSKAIQDDYDALLEKSKKEKMTIESWWKEEQSKNKNKEDENRKLSSKLMQIEAELKTAQHNSDVKTVEINHLENLIGTLRETHEKEQMDLLDSRSAELQRFDEKLRDRDEELNRMHYRLRDAILKGSQFKEELERKEEAWKSQLQGMRQAVTETLNDGFFFSNDMEQSFSRSQALRRNQSYNDLARSQSRRNNVATSPDRKKYANRDAQFTPNMEHFSSNYSADQTMFTPKVQVKTRREENIGEKVNSNNRQEVDESYEDSEAEIEYEDDSPRSILSHDE